MTFVSERVRAEYPDYLRNDVERALASYGVESSEREPERVRTAILSLAAGDAGELAYLVRAAKQDYRDVLMWHDSPVESMHGRPIIAVRYYKWGGRPHWSMHSRALGEDAYGRWFGGAAGIPAQRGFEEPIVFGMPHVLVVPQDAWWTAVFNPRGHDARVYVDICTPASWRDGSPRMVDLDLDVIELADGTVMIDDEDEFEEHQVLYGYPQDVVVNARAACVEVRAMLSRRVEPFGGVGARWLDRFVCGEFD